MGQELANQFEIAKDVFSEVDDALGRKTVGIDVSRRY